MARLRLAMLLAVGLIASCSASMEAAPEENGAANAIESAPVDAAPPNDMDSTESGASELDANMNGAPPMANGSPPMANGSSASALPAFPLPAPAPSARVALSRTLFGGNPHTVGDIERRLARELDARGYDQRSYFRAPRGFALVTQVERIDSAGRPRAGNDRWVTVPLPLIDRSNFSLANIVTALRNAEPGRYRLIVFLVTTTARTTGSASMPFDGAQTLVEGGGDYLPQAIARIPLGPEHNVSALIYEFARASVRADATFVKPSGINGSTHLRAARLFGGR